MARQRFGVRWQRCEGRALASATPLWEGARRGAPCGTSPPTSARLPKAVWRCRFPPHSKTLARHATLDSFTHYLITHSPMLSRLLPLLVVLAAFPLHAAEVETARAALLRGDHAAAEAEAALGAAEDRRNEDWALLRAEALAAVGKYVEARDTIAEALTRSRARPVESHP